MATSIILYNSSYFLELATAPYGVLSGALGQPEQERVFSRPWGKGYAPPAGTNWGNRTAQFTIKLTGSGIDDWATNSRQLREVLTQAQLYHDTQGQEGEPGYLAIQLDGQTTAVEWDILGGVLGDDAIGQYHMTVPATRGQYDVPLTLTLKPWARPQALTRVTSGNLTNGTDSYTVTPEGDRETPVRVTIQTAAGDDFRRVLLARRAYGAPANYLFVLEAETGSHAGYTTAETVDSAAITEGNAVDASAHGGNVFALDYDSAGSYSGDTLQWTINSDLPDHWGRHRVYLLTGAPSADATFTSATLSYGGSAGKDISNEAITPNNGSRRLFYLGEIVIPHRAAPPNVTLASFLFALATATGSAAGNGIMPLDCIFLLPSDEQLMDVTLSATASAQDQLVNDNLSDFGGGLYVLDSSGNWQPEYPVSPTFDQRFTLVPGRPNRFLPLVIEDANNTVNLTDVLTITCEYYPLYELFIT